MAEHHPAAADRAGAPRPAGPAADPRGARGEPGHQHGGAAQGTWLSHRHGLDPGRRRRQLRGLPAGVLPADGQRQALVVPLPGPRQASYPLRLLGLSLTMSCRRTTRRSPLAAPAGNSASSPWRWPGRPAARSAGRSATVPPWRRGRPRAPRRTCRPGRRAVRDVPAIGRRAARRSWAGNGAAGSKPADSRSDTGHDPSAVDHEQRAPRSARNIIGHGRDHAQPPSRVVPAIATSGYLAASQLHTRIDRLGPGRRVLGPGPDRGLGGQVPDRVRAEPGADRRPRGGQRRARRRPGAAAAGDPACGCAPVAAGYRTCRPGRPSPIRARQQAALLHNPLLKAPRQVMLAVGAAALLLGVLGLSVSVAASLRTRRTQSAVLAALGVGRRAQAGQLCLEQFAAQRPGRGRGPARRDRPGAADGARDHAEHWRDGPGAAGPGGRAARPGRRPGPDHRRRCRWPPPPCRSYAGRTRPPQLRAEAR